MERYSPVLERTAASMQQVTDQLGKGIDPGIFESVVVLNALQFSTQQSCEGHVGRGRPAPWITFTSPEAVTLSRDAARLFAQGEQAEKTQGEVAAQLLYEQANHFKRSAEAVHSQNQRRLIEYLAAFYSDYRPAYDRLLVVYSRHPACSILESQGATSLVGQPLVVQAEKLSDYQDEMHLFTAFLKDYYF
jgi:hypothetical protein